MADCRPWHLGSQVGLPEPIAQEGNWITIHVQSQLVCTEAKNSNGRPVGLHQFPQQKIPNSGFTHWNGGLPEGRTW